MNVKDERKLRLLQAAGELPAIPGKSGEYTIWYFSNGLDERGITYVEWVKAYQAKCLSTERAAIKALLGHLNGKGEADTFAPVLMGILTLGEIDGVITVTKEQSAVWHARLYDTRQKYKALVTAYGVANRGNKASASDMLKADALAFMRAWARAIDPKWAGDLHAALTDLMSQWAVKYDMALPIDGLKGVSFSEKENRWQARVTVNGKQQRLGWYRQKGEACLALLKHKAAAQVAAKDTPAKDKPAPKPRKLAKMAQADKYIGIVECPAKEGRWAIRVSEAYQEAVEAFEAEQQSDYLAVNDGVGLVFGDYSTRQYAAQGYDRFARRYLPTPRLNFPEWGELDGMGNVYGPAVRGKNPSAALGLFDRLCGARKLAAKSQERAKRGVLSVTKHGDEVEIVKEVQFKNRARPVVSAWSEPNSHTEVFVGQEAAWLLARCSWVALPDYVSAVFAQGRPNWDMLRAADEFEAYVDHKAREAREAGNALKTQERRVNSETRRTRTYDVLFGYFPSWDYAQAAFEQWERNSGHAIWTEDFFESESGNRVILSLEDAVFAALTGRLPAQGIVHHAGKDKSDYSHANLKAGGSTRESKAA